MNNKITINVENLKNEIINLENEIQKLDQLSKIIKSSNQTDSIEKLNKEYEVLRNKLYTSKRLLKDLAFNHILTDDVKMRQIVDGYKRNTEEFLKNKRDQSIELQDKIDTYTKTLNTLDKLPKREINDFLKDYDVNRSILNNNESNKKVARELFNKLNGNKKILSEFQGITDKIYYPSATYNNKFYGCKYIEKSVQECLALLYEGVADNSMENLINKYSDSPVVFYVIQQCYEIVKDLEFNSQVNDQIASEIFKDTSKRSDKIYTSSVSYYSKEDFIKKFPYGVPRDIEKLISQEQKENGRIVDYKEMTGKNCEYAMSTYLYYFFKNKGVTTITKEVMEQLTPAEILILNNAYKLNKIHVSAYVNKPYDYNHYSIQLKDDSKNIKASLKDLKEAEEEKENVERDIERYEQELNYYNNTSLTEIMKNKFSGYTVLDKNSIPVSKEARICIDNIQKILSKFEENKKRDNLINGFEETDLGKLYNKIKNIHNSEEIYKQMQKYNNKEKDYTEFIERDNNLIKDREQTIDNLEQKKQSYESDKDSVIFKNKKDKVVNNPIGRFFFKTFNRKLYLSNMETYKEEIQKFDSQINRFKDSITILSKNIEMHKEKKQQNLNEKQRYINTQNFAGINVEEVCKYRELPSYVANGISVHEYTILVNDKNKFLENIDNLKNEFKEELEKLSQIPNLPNDIINEVGRLKKVYEETMEVTNSSLNSQSISQQAIDYDQRLKDSYKDIDPELFNRLYSGNYDFSMTGEQADEIFSGKSR